MFMPKKMPSNNHRICLGLWSKRNPKGLANSQENSQQNLQDFYLPGVSCQSLVASAKSHRSAAHGRRPPGWLRPCERDRPWANRHPGGQTASRHCECWSPNLQRWFRPGILKVGRLELGELCNIDVQTVKTCHLKTIQGYIQYILMRSYEYMVNDSQWV